MTSDDIRDFNAYLRQCTDNQVRGVWEHEKTRGGDGEQYAALAEAEAAHRNIELEG